jgi:hypothetical protein
MQTFWPSLSVSCFRIAWARWHPAPIQKKFDGLVKNPSAALRRNCKCASLLSFCAPCIWSFLRNHRRGDFLRDHQVCLHKFIAIAKKSPDLTATGLPDNIPLWHRMQELLGAQDCFPTPIYRHACSHFSFDDRFPDSLSLVNRRPFNRVSQGLILEENKGCRSRFIILNVSKGELPANSKVNLEIEILNAQSIERNLNQIF